MEREENHRKKTSQYIVSIKDVHRHFCTKSISLLSRQFIMNQYVSVMWKSFAEALSSLASIFIFFTDLSWL